MGCGGKQEMSRRLFTHLNGFVIDDGRAVNHRPKTTGPIFITGFATVPPLPTPPPLFFLPLSLPPPSLSLSLSTPLPPYHTHSPN